MNTTNVSKYAGNVILVYFKDSVKGGCMTIKIQHPSDPTGWDLGRGRSSRKLSTGSPLPGRQLPSPPSTHTRPAQPATQERVPIPACCLQPASARGNSAATRREASVHLLSTQQTSLSFGLSLPATLHRDRKRKPLGAAAA